MKKRNLLALLSILIFSSSPLMATDRVVQYNGPTGTYASISAAITASADGDNIVVNNRPDATPWVENISINKSLTFVSGVDNVQWWMEGTILITLGEARNVTFIGMKNSSTTGGLTKTGAIPVSRTLINLLYCDMAGDITTVSGVNLYVGSSKAKNISFSFGKIIGNDLGSVLCSPDASTTEDVNQVIGNRIGYNSMANYGFQNNTTTQYLFFSNNYSRGSYAGAQISALKSGAIDNRIANCTLSTYASGSGTYIYGGLTIAQASGQLNVDNSILCGNVISLGNIYGSNGVVTASSTAAALTTFTYNLYYNSYNSNISLNTSQGNTVLVQAEYDNINANGIFSSGTVHVNAGSPMNEYLDLDLTRNDVGVYGGSYSMANFMPLMSNTESSRVNYMSTPRVVNQGGSVNVQVIGFDK